jgi:hypothetical protein
VNLRLCSSRFSAIQLCSRFSVFVLRAQLQGLQRDVDVAC